MAAQPGSSPLEALVDLLARHRLALFLVYVCLVVAIATGIYGFTTLGWPAIFDYVVPGRDLNELAEWEGGHTVEAWLFVAILIALQALFIFGGGRIPLKSIRSGIWRTLVPVAIAGVAVVVMLTTFAFTVAEMFDRANGEGSIRGTALLDLAWLEVDSGILTWLLIIWLAWMVAALAIFRRSDQENVLRRLTCVLLAGSWIEFLVALPVDIAIRQRADNCICATGSWLALIVAIPIMIFAFGPAMYLLYLREVERGRTEPRRAMRILLHKSRRDSAGGRE